MCTYIRAPIVPRSNSLTLAALAGQALREGGLLQVRPVVVDAPGDRVRLAGHQGHPPQATQGRSNSYTCIGNRGGNL